jgi:hypothetical protein
MEGKIPFDMGITTYAFAFLDIAADRGTGIECFLSKVDDDICPWFLYVGFFT